jgi:hypothetical protein
MGTGNRGFEQMKCTFQNCYTSTIRSKLRDNHTRVDAILFHGVGMKKNEIKALKLQRKEIRNMNQGVDPLFILFMLVSIIITFQLLRVCFCLHFYLFQESPLGADLKDPLFNDFFNLTLTYSPNADIPRPYGVFQNKYTKEQQINHWPPVNDTNFNYTSLGLPTLSQRIKDIAWIVSHCPTDSHRERYVKKLKKVTKYDFVYFFSRI